MNRGPTTWEQAALSGLLIVVLVYGVLVEIRATCTKKHNTDMGVYLAAAQAIRDNRDIYTTTYNGDHYMYPPFLAILLAHIVPAPEPSGPPSSVAFATTVSLWYIFSLLALAGAVWVLARVLFRTVPETGPPRWPVWHPLWTVGFLPVVICLHCLGRELQLGQVDLFSLALLAMTIAAAAKGRSYQAGAWLAAAISLKVMPVVLLVYPLWRRDWRWLLSAAVGVVVGLVILPVLTLGYDQTVKYTEEYARVLLLPALTGKVTDHTRDDEMLNQNAVHNYSILGVLHNVANLSTPREDRPKTPSEFNRHVAGILRLALVFLTLLASGFRRQVSPPATVLCLAMLTTVMIITNPVCQSYYFVLLIPLFMAVIFADLQRSGAAFPSRGIIAVCVAYPVAQALASFSPFLRDCGLVLATVLVLWLAAFIALRRFSKQPATENFGGARPMPVVALP